MLRNGFLDRGSYGKKAWPLSVSARIYSFMLALAVIFSVTAVEAMGQESPARTEIEAYAQAAMAKISTLKTKRDELWKREIPNPKSRDDIRKNMEVRKEELELRRENHICVRGVYSRFEEYYKLEGDSEITNRIGRQLYLIDRLYSSRTRAIEALIKSVETGDDKLRKESSKIMHEMIPLRSEFWWHHSYFRELWRDRFNFVFDTGFD